MSLLAWLILGGIVVVVAVAMAALVAADNDPMEW
jgi:hypothetical protein